METVSLVKTKDLKKNQTTLGIYLTPKNYVSIKENIENTNIIEPLIVNQDTMVIISGNLRHQIAEELGFETVPVIFRAVDEQDMDFISISSNQFREKSHSEKLREIEFFEKYFSIKKGQRTDLNEGSKRKKEQRDQALSHMSSDTIDKLKSINKLATELHGRDSREYQKVFQKLDEGQSTLSGMNQHLIDLKKKKHNEQVIPEKYHFKMPKHKVYNHSSANMWQIATGSIHAIITSPPYFQMIDYGTGKEQLGMESSVELYLDNLMKVFKECQRVLVNDGSLFVNINDCADNGVYNAVPHKFVIRMIEMGWMFNDEILWIKNNPTYTRGKRSVRSHEPVFHFVKSPNFYYDDSWLKKLTDPDNAISYGTNNQNPKLISALDFRDGVLRTNVANTSELRKDCEKKGFYMTHNATFPLDVPTICAITTTEEGDTILDCFSGTSVVGEFAIKNNRNFIGYELKPEFVKASEVRIMRHPYPGTLQHHIKNGTDVFAKGLLRNNII